MLVSTTKGRVYKPGGVPAKKAEFESYTSISKYIECPTLYHDYYASRKREPISKELIFGRAWHATCEDALVEKLWNNRDMTALELAERWHVRWVVELELAKDEFVWKGDQSPEDYFKTGTLLMVTWQRDYLPKLKPRVIEAQFWIELSGLKRALAGRLDVITTDGMVDHKTSGKTWDELKKLHRLDKDELDLQMAIYHGGYQEICKSWPKVAELHRAVLGNPAKMETINVLYTVDDVQKTFDQLVKPTIKAIEDDWKSGTFACVCGKHKPKAATGGTDASSPKASSLGQQDIPPTVPPIEVFYEY